MYTATKQNTVFLLCALLLIVASLLMFAGPALAAEPITVFLDGSELKMPAEPVIVEGSVMVPIANLAKAIGATVEWDATNKTVTIVRDYKTIVLQIGSANAVVNGDSVPLAAAPFIENGSTLLPLRFVSEQLKQKVEWDAEKRSVYVTEDRSFLREGNNLDAWMLGASAIIANRNMWSDPYTPFMAKRSEIIRNTAKPMLAGSWGSGSRKELLNTINNMTLGGHNVDFMVAASLYRSLNAEQQKELIQNSSDMDAYMWPMVDSLYEKWGDRGILAWDWYRMIHLSCWGYLAGYLELQESYYIIENIAYLLQNTFSSWDEATENYLDGYAFWARTDLSKPNNEFESRTKKYQALKDSQEEYGLIFDDSVWTTEIVGLQEDRIEQVVLQMNLTLEED